MAPTTVERTWDPARLDLPLHWSHPARVLVNATPDLFAEDARRSFLIEVFAVIAWAKRHTFHLRPQHRERATAELSVPRFWFDVGGAARRLGYAYGFGEPYLADDQNIFDVEAWMVRRSLPNLVVDLDDVPACSGCSSPLCPDCSGRVTV